MAKESSTEKYFVEIAHPVRDLGLFAKAEPIGIAPKRINKPSARKNVLPVPKDHYTANAAYRAHYLHNMVPKSYKDLKCKCEDPKSVEPISKELFEEQVKWCFNQFDEQISGKMWNLCQASDSHGNKNLKCGKEGQSFLARPDEKIPFRAFCDDHKKRMSLHECCPTCGNFCTTGVFNVCNATEKTHLFHVRCGTFLGLCPHCGSNNYSRKLVAVMEREAK